MSKKLIKNVSPGKYFPGNSFVHKLDPRVKIVFSATLFFVIFYSSTYISALLLILYSLFLAYKSEIPIIKYLKSTKGILIISAFTASINLFFELETSFLSSGYFAVKAITIKNSLLIFFRLFVIAVSSTIVMFTTSYQDFSFALEKILSPLKFIKINPQEISLTITIALKFIPVLFEETNKIVLAQKARGANFKNKNIFKQIKSYSAIFIPVLISSFKKSEDLAIAMECRCYNSSKQRTKLNNLNMKNKDIIFLVLTLIFFAGVIVCNNLINF